MEATIGSKKNGISLRKLFSLFDNDNRVIRILLSVAGLISLSSGYTFYTQQLGSSAQFYQDTIIGAALIFLVFLSFVINAIKKHLQLILILTVYALMAQSISECRDADFEMNNTVGLLITFIVTSMPFKKASQLWLFVIFNFILVVFAIYSVNPKVDADILVWMFAAVGVASIFTQGAKLRVQEKLRKSEDLFKNIFNESADANFLTDMKNPEILSCNNKAVEMFEVTSKEDLIGINPYSLQKEAFSNTDLDNIQKQIHDNWGWSKELQYKTKKEKTFWGNLEFRVVQFNNKPHFQIRITDISERKRLEHMLLAEKQVLELASKDPDLDNPLNLLLKNIEDISGEMKCAVLFFNEERTELHYNNINSLPVEFTKAVGPLPSVLGFNQAGTVAVTKKPVIAGNIESSEYWKDYLLACRRNKIASCSSFPIMAESGEILGVFDVYYSTPHEPSEKDMEIISRAVNIMGVLIEKDRAVTENKLSLERIKVKNEELIKTNTELDRFVYSTSHDLRAPLMNVLGLIDITEMQVAEVKPKSYLTMMKTSIQALDDTIKGILEYSKNARTDVELEQVDMHELAEQTLAGLQFMDGADLIEKKLKFDIQIPFYTDKTRLGVILNNIISNSIKYRNKKQEKPFVEITARVTAEKAFITISDNGIGIKPEYKDKIFDMFFRATTQGTGSGLGLYILKETLGKLNGKISVSSTPNEGTAFEIEIPNIKLK